MKVKRLSLLTLSSKLIIIFCIVTSNLFMLNVRFLWSSYVFCLSFHALLEPPFKRIKQWGYKLNKKLIWKVLQVLYNRFSCRFRIQAIAKDYYYEKLEVYVRYTFELIKFKISCELPLKVTLLCSFFNVV